MTILPGTAEWLEERRKYICASDAPKILGFSRWGSGLDVCLEKWGEAEEGPETQAQKRGKLLQMPVAIAYSKRRGLRLGPEQFLVHPKHQWMAATPDARIMGHEMHLQVKTHTSWMQDEYGEEGSEDVPEAEIVQVLHELEVLGTESADLAVLFGEEEAFKALCSFLDNGALTIDDIADYILKEMDMRIFTIKRKKQLQKDIIEAEKEFRDKYILSKKLPPDTPYKQNKPIIRKASIPEIMLIEELREAWLKKERYALKYDDVKGKAKKIIGEDKGIDAGDGDKITWNKAKDTIATYVNWMAIAEELDVPKDIIEKHTKYEPVTDWQRAVKASEIVKDYDFDKWGRLLRKYTESKVIRQGVRRFLVPNKKWGKDI